MRKLLFMLIALCCLLVLGGVATTIRAEERAPSFPEAPPAMHLSLEGAIGLALKNNYDLLLAQEAIRESEGVAFTRLGAMLPNLSGETAGWRQKTFDGVFGGRPRTSTPRDIYDLRARLRQPVFSLNLIRQWRAGRVGVEIAGKEAEVARRDTIATAAVLYLEALRGEAAVKARESNVALNQELLKLTKGRKRAGAATGIDVVRAQGQLESERRLLLVARNERKRAQLNLIRGMGIPDRTPLALTGKLVLQDHESMTADEAVLQALTHREELRAQAQRERFAKLSLDAITGERVPAVEIRGDYGLIGEEFGDRLATYLVGAFLTVPLFDGQREGRYSETKSQLRQAEIQTRSLVQQISLEAREAQQTLESTRDQVLVAREALRLALEELRLSRKAFSIGTLTHFEVIGTQIRLAGTRDTAIDALFSYNAARVNMARAQGRMHLIYKGHMVVDGSFKRARIHQIMARGIGRW